MVAATYVHCFVLHRQQSLGGQHYRFGHRHASQQANNYRKNVLESALRQRLATGETAYAATFA